MRAITIMLIWLGTTFFIAVGIDNKNGLLIGLGVGFVLLWIACCVIEIINAIHDSREYKK